MPAAVPSPAAELPADLTDALANARTEVLASADSELSFATRRGVLRLLGPVARTEDGPVGAGHARRIRLCATVLRRVLPVWQSAYPDSVAVWEPERVIELAKARLAGWASYRLLRSTADSLVTFAENADAGPAFPVARATVCAAFVAAFDEALDPDPELDDPQDPDLWDCAFWSAGAAAGAMPWVAGFDRQRYLSFWLWYLDEAVPAAYRAVPDGGGNGDVCGPEVDLEAPDDPLAATYEAVAVYRRLARTGRDRERHWLAVAFDRLSACAHSAGRLAEAATARREATAIWRRLATIDPGGGRYRRRFAESTRLLQMLALQLTRRAGRGEDLAAAEQAVAILRELAEADPEEHLSALADAVYVLSLALEKAGERGDGLAATEELVAIMRRLAEADDEWLAGLADALYCLALDLSALGRPEESLAATEEAVTIRREQVETDPERNQPDLVKELRYLSGTLRDLRRPQEALAAAEEAVVVAHELAGADPKYLSALAGSLDVLADRLRDLDRRHERLPVLEERVAIERRLAADDPQRRPFLADALSALSCGLCCERHGVGRGPEGERALEEATSVRRDLATAEPTDST